MKKYQYSNNIIYKTKPSISGRHSITHPPDILSMSSLSGSLATEKDLSETIAHLTTPSNSMSLSTTSNRSIIIDKKRNLSVNRKKIPVQNSSSKKTFTLNKTGQRQSSSKSRRQTSSSLQLIDAYRFRDTLRMSNTHFTSPRAKLR